MDNPQPTHRGTGFQAKRRVRTYATIGLLALGAWALVSTLLTSVAAAHGPGAAALELIDEDMDGPSVVRLTTGLAQRGADGNWHFVCPTAWGAVESPLVAAADAGPVWVVGSNQAYTLAADGVLVDTGEAQLNATFTVGLARTPSHVYALTTDGATSALWRLDGDGTARIIVDDTANSWTTIVATGEDAWLARRTATGITFRRFDQTGSAIEAHDVMTDSQASVLLQAAGDDLFVLRIGGTEFELSRLDTTNGLLEPVLADTKPILGPVLVDGRLLVGLRGDLLDITDGGSVVIESEETMACVGALGDHAYACLLPDLADVTIAGYGDALFRTERLLGPVLGNLPAALEEACFEDWLHFTFEGNIPLDSTLDLGPDTLEVDAGPDTMEGPVDQAEAMEMAETDPPTSDPGCGCQTRKPAPSGWGLWALVAVLVVMRRQV